LRLRTVLLTCCCVIGGVLAAPSPALAGDANSVPPRITLTAAGQEGFIGPRAQALAYFSTPDFGEADESWRYSKGSKVRFACSLDGRPVHCTAEHLLAEEGPGVLLRPGGNQRVRYLPSPYYGSVSLPEHLASGPHVVTVVASDEDGTDPTPPSVTVMMDRTPPSAPQLTQEPPRFSRVHKPVFRFGAGDNLRLVGHRTDTFTGSLRRLKPAGFVWKSNAFADSFLSIWFPRCPDLLTCSTRAQASYMVSEGWYSYGEPERLGPGLYELRLRSWDAVLNKSPLTTYRFRILRGKAR